MLHIFATQWGYCILRSYRFLQNQFRGSMIKDIQSHLLAWGRGEHELGSSREKNNSAHSVYAFAFNRPPTMCFETKCEAAARLCLKDATYLLKTQTGCLQTT